ncbi:FUSC family protein [Gelidibacter salicanalis]|uniref:FUSC family protein n=1 Tax=Gelidibacter salicanalis TaxID=291193 RepID=A0A934KU60_9FLAO|nr:FUSC family protein [Gelidibacter salicanalis]MBJ7881426.1 FUSC family protein [Gelidibacter salicanalis]
MKRLWIVLGLIAAILALILSVTKFFNVAYTPAIAALIFGMFAFYLSRQKEFPKKTIQLIFLLTIIAVVLSSYKLMFVPPENIDLENIEVIEENQTDNVPPPFQESEYNQRDLIRDE